MYFGSVRFFKHVILATIVITISALVLAVVHLNGQNRGLLSDIEQLQLQLQQIGQPQDPNTGEPKLDPQPSGEDPSASDGPSDPLAQIDAAPLPYQELYPELYCESPYEAVEQTGKVMYLTFDDGPTAITDDILDKLKALDVKATFFIIGTNIRDRGDLLKRIVDEGHTIGVHTYSHKYREIYESVESFLEDFSLVHQAIFEATGVKPEIFRFPGGSVNGYNAPNYQEIIAEMLRRGFIYFDWNISAEDTYNTSSTKSVTHNLLRDFERFEQGIVLMHETSYSLNALGEVVSGYQNAGFTFDRLQRGVKQIIFSYPD